MTDKPVADDIVKRLRDNSQLVVCPYDRRSPDYWTTNDVDPCKFCGAKNDVNDTTVCPGADLRVMTEAADEIEHLRALAQQPVAKPGEDELSPREKRILEVLEATQNAMASARLLVFKYSPDHHWMPHIEQDIEAVKAVIDELRAAQRTATERGDDVG